MPNDNFGHTRGRLSQGAKNESSPKNENYLRNSVDQFRPSPQYSSDVSEHNGGHKATRNRDGSFREQGHRPAPKPCQESEVASKNSRQYDGPQTRSSASMPFADCGSTSGANNNESVPQKGPKIGSSADRFRPSSSSSSDVSLKQNKRAFERPSTSFGSISGQTRRPERKHYRESEDTPKNSWCSDGPPAQNTASLPFNNGQSTKKPLFARENNNETCMGSSGSFPDMTHPPPRKPWRESQVTSKKNPPKLILDQNPKKELPVNGVTGKKTENAPALENKIVAVSFTHFRVTVH